MKECLFISYTNYNGGINNLIIVEDKNGNFATSTKSINQAIKNYIKKFGGVYYDK